MYDTNQLMPEHSHQATPKRYYIVDTGTGSLIPFFLEMTNKLKLEKKFKKLTKFFFFSMKRTMSKLFQSRSQ